MPRETPQQKQWLKTYLEAHPKCELRRREACIDGRWSYLIQWDEEIIPFVVVDDPDLNPGFGWQTKQMKITLNRTAKQVLRDLKVINTAWLRCSLEYRFRPGFGQTTLPLSALLEIASSDVSTEIYRRQALGLSPWQPRVKPISGKSDIQHELPLDKISQQIMQIRLDKGAEILNKIELLNEQGEYYSEALSKRFQMPQVLIDLLRDLNATPEEWESTDRLLGVLGECGALKYVQSIPDWRKINS